MRALAGLLVVLLLGCVQAGGSSTPPEDEAAPRIALHGCENLSGTFPVPVGDAQALLPPGFAVRRTGASAVDGAVMYVVAARCASAAVDGADVGEALIGYAELDVVPPADVVLGTDHVMPVFFAASPPSLGDALAALHLGRAGAGTVERADLAGGGAAFTVTMDGSGFRLAGAATSSATARDAGTFRAFGVQDGELLTVVDGAYAQGQGRQAALVLSPIGEAPLVSKSLRPAARGGTIAGYQLSFAPIPN